MGSVLVIGAGLAGLMGALALADAGQRTTILAKGHGTTHWASGTIDIFGYEATAPALPVESPAAAVERLIARDGGHPYALIGMDGLTAAVDRFRKLMIAEGYPYTGTLHENILLPTATGALRPTALVPPTMVAGDMRQAGEVLVVGFREVRDFYPPFVAANLRAQGYPARGIYLQMPPTGRKWEFFPTVVARMFDEPAFRAEVARQITAVRGEARRIAFPAVLGYEHPVEALEDLEQQCGARIFEIPTLPPSVPGIRLWERMRNALTRLGVRFEIGTEIVRGGELPPDTTVSQDGATPSRVPQLHSVWSRAAAREREHPAHAFLLATGGIGGGGLVAEDHGAVRETALGLPVAGFTDRTGWFSPQVDGVHPLFRTGVRTDDRLSPRDRDGRILYTNVAVAGGTLAGADVIGERSLEGIALATGWAAGQYLAAELMIDQ